MASWSEGSRESGVMSRTGVEMEEGSVAWRITDEIVRNSQAYARRSPSRYIHTGFQYKLPADFGFWNSKIRTRQCQSESWE